MSFRITSRTRVLVLGASGQVGLELVRSLSHLNCKLTLVRKSTWAKKSDKANGAKLVSLDLPNASQRKLKNLVRDQDVIFHLAADTSVQTDLSNEYPFYINQVSLLKRILGCIVGSGTGLIYASSCSVYGIESQALVTDKSPANPVTSYDLAKTACDQLISFYREVYNVPCSSLRFSNIYGSDEGLDENKKNRRVINKMLHQMHVKHQIRFVGDGMFYRNYLHVVDAANMLVAVCNNLHKPKDIYIACSKKNIYFVDAIMILANRYEKLFNVKIAIGKGLKDMYITDRRSFKLKPSLFFTEKFNYKYSIESGFNSLIEDLKFENNR